MEKGKKSVFQTFRKMKGSSTRTRDQDVIGRLIILCKNLIRWANMLR